MTERCSPEPFHSPPLCPPRPLWFNIQATKLRIPCAGDVHRAHARVLLGGKDLDPARIDQRLEIARERGAIHVERIGQRGHRCAA